MEEYIIDESTSWQDDEQTNTSIAFRDILAGSGGTIVIMVIGCILFTAIIEPINKICETLK
jgi:hypothetical protein